MFDKVTDILRKLQFWVDLTIFMFINLLFVLILEINNIKMNKLLTTILAASVVSLASAQVKTPKASAHAELDATVGLTEIEVEYSRPNKNNRVVFGDVVPFDKIWRTGANKNTTIEFSDDVTVGGAPLKAGKYAIYTKPGKSAWEVYFYTDTENWGNPQTWDDAKVAAKAVAKVEQLSQPVETFTISVDDLKMDKANLTFSWDKTRAVLPIVVPTDAKVMATIENTMNAEPKAGDFIAAANYYASTGKDAQLAKDWMDKGMSLMKEPQYYHYHQQAVVYANAGDFKGAVEIAKKSLEGAKAAGDDAYVKKNEVAIKEWANKK